MLLEFVLHVKKDSPTEEMDWSGLLFILLEIGSYVDQVTGFRTTGPAASRSQSHT